MYQNNIKSEVLYSTRTLAVNVSQLLALHVFHVRRPLEFHSATMFLCGHSVCFDTCYLRFAAPARCRVPVMVSHVAIGESSKELTKPNLCILAVGRNLGCAPGAILG